MKTLTMPSRLDSQSASYGSRISVVLAAAFTLSAIHTVYSYLAGIEDPQFTVTTPVAWAFYLIGFGFAALARRDHGWAPPVLLAYLSVLLLVAVFYYPTTFETRQQTVFGWFENDVYTGLLMIAWYLTVQRLRRVTLSTGVGGSS